MDDGILTNLSLPPSEEEIKTALFNMALGKAPSPDGFRPIFFQKSWDILGHRLIQLVKDVFTSRVVPPNLNETFICLIPKKKGPTEVTDFRPISLCNTVYKIISKLLVNRLRPILPNVISPFQTGFIKGTRVQIITR